MSKTASHAQKATQYFKIQACGATKWSRMPGFLEYLFVIRGALRGTVKYDIINAQWEKKLYICAVNLTIGWLGGRATLVISRSLSRVLDR